VSGALNGLFQRLRDSRERERNFTAFAAHELRTPLAGLSTQAQVALASSDGDVRDQALRRIIQGVDRTGRLVRQLLDLTEIEAGREPLDREPLPLARIIGSRCAYRQDHGLQATRTDHRTEPLRGNAVAHEQSSAEAAAQGRTIV
jgi:two-component system sensor histidine kinase QseC